MTDSHDPMCPQHGQTMRSIIAFDTPCRCEFIDRVRADERATAQVQACDAHISQVRWAEAVAAKLVEVICDDEHWRREAVFTVIRRLIAERDAARAEVAALRKQEWAAPFRREVLADLRTKVEGMRDEAKADPVGSAVWRTTAYESVLALIEEAQND